MDSVYVSREIMLSQLQSGCLGWRETKLCPRQLCIISMSSAIYLVWVYPEHERRCKQTAVNVKHKQRFKRDVSSCPHLAED